MTSLRLRFLWPAALSTLCLVTLCAVTAVSLFSQQATIADVLRENVGSRRAATELEECLTDLLALLRGRVESVAPMHERLRYHLAVMGQYADQPEEQEMYARMARGFDDYLKRWEAMPPPGRPGHEQAVRDAAAVLDAELLRPCLEFEQYNGLRIEDSTRHHEQVLRQLAWGMAGVGALGGFAGLVLGYGVAHGLSRSIRRLQVRIRDAAGMLGRAFPEIVVTEVGDFRDLHEEVDRLTARIEGVVQELQEREHEVLRAEQLAAVGQLAAGVAHEIRNPLTSIKMLVQAGMEDGAAGLAGEDLRVIEQEVRRVERSLQTFLDFARPAKPHRRPVDAAEVARAVLGLVRGRADKQRVELTLDAPPDGATLTADADQLQQVLVNLALNALDAMPQGGALTVGVRRRPDRCVELTVADTGAGILREMAGRMFEPFASSKATGLGLGLVISKRIVEDHGGTIEAGNRSGGGAVFRVTLPAGGR